MLRDYKLIWCFPKGLGADQSHDDNWLVHQEAFNELLSQLNNVNEDGKVDPYFWYKFTLFKIPSQKTVFIIYKAYETLLTKVMNPIMKRLFQN